MPMEQMKDSATVASASCALAKTLAGAADACLPMPSIPQTLNDTHQAFSKCTGSNRTLLFTCAERKTGKYRKQKVTWEACHQGVRWNSLLDDVLVQRSF